MLPISNHREAPRCCGPVLATCWVIALALLGPPAAASESEAVRILRQADGTSAAPGLVDELARSELADLFQVLVDGTLPLPGVVPEEASFGSRVATVLSAIQRAALEQAIGRTPAPALRRFLMTNVTPEASRAERKACLALLRPSAGAGDLHYAIALVRGGLPRLSRDLEELLAQALVNDSNTYGRVKEELGTRDAPLRAALIRGLGGAESERALLLLNGLLFADDPHLELLLEQIGRLAGSLGPPHDDVVRDSVRHFLSADDAGVVAAAAHGAAALGDSAAIPDFIALLEHPSSSVRSAAKSALMGLTGLRFATPRRWFLWYEAERAWWDTRWPVLAPALEGATRETITALLAEAIGKRLERDWLATEIAGLLASDDPLVRRLACQSLGQLESTTVALDLLAAMTDPDEAVARSAWNALRAVTRRDLPFDPGACSPIIEQLGDR